ncbi:MAG: hypothetical protein E7168_00705 [Firmicutes bacterium]|nr:hypothetical protein [Bacillota bacterium]
MKKIFSSYYSNFVILSLIISNIFLANLQVNGILYNLLMTAFILFNIASIIKYKKDIKNKKLALITSIIILIFSKNIYHTIFIATNTFLLLIITISTSKSLKMIIMLILCCILLSPYTFIYILIITLNSKKTSNIYEDTHYYCENNYEIYAYSSGAMDRFHYSIGKYYVLLNFGNIINISYRERNETTIEEYNYFLNTNNCSLVGE